MPIPRHYLPVILIPAATIAAIAIVPQVLSRDRLVRQPTPTPQAIRQPAE